MENEAFENELKLTDVIDVDTLQQLQDSFSDMTGIAALITDKNGVQITKPSNFTDLCIKYTRAGDKSCNRCNECNKNGTRATMEKGEPYEYECFAGLINFTAPIIINGHIIGSFIGGQILTKEPDLEKYRQIAEELGIDPDVYIKEVKKVRVIDSVFAEKATRFLFTTANMISRIAYNDYILKQSYKKVEEAARAKSDFLANMSHEIRTPMNAVLGMAEMAMREEMSSAARDCLHQIRTAGKNLLVIINDILDFSKIESGKMEIVPVTYECLSIFNDLASIVNNRIGEKNIEFTMDVSLNLPHMLMGDNVRFQQVLVNVLNNAVKFTKQGQVHLKVEGEPIDSETILIKASVSDTGIGIKPEDMGKMFKSFQQVDSKRNRNIEGTGLGLAISKQLLKLMGGNITAASEYNKGSTFYIELPQKIISKTKYIPSISKETNVALFIGNKYVKEQIIRDLEKVNIHYEDMEEAESLNSESYDFFIVERTLFSNNLRTLFLSNDNLRCIVIDDFDSANDNLNSRITIVRKPVFFLNLYVAMGILSDYTRDDGLSEDDFSFIAPDAKVLIVDDNTVNLIVARGLLEPLKMQIDTATSAAETIEIIRQTKYDLIFMDHMMPEVDGIETTHIIRRLMQDYANIPIIALTANAVEGTKEMFIREGMNDFVAKPIDTKQITAKLRKWLPQEKIIPVDKSEASDSDSGNKPDINISELNVASAVSLLGSESLFWTVLKEYYASIDKKLAAIEKFYADKDWKNYTIEVHSLKSTSKQVGADELSELAAKLEKAGNDNDEELIMEKTDEMLNMYRRLKAVLTPYFPEFSVSTPKKTADPTEIMEFLSELQTALEDYDTLVIDEVIEKMSHYQYEDVFDELFQQLKVSAEASDIDICAELAHQWKREVTALYIDR